MKIGPHADLSAVQFPKEMQNPGKVESGFASLLENSLNEVNQLLLDSDKQAQNLVLGKSENLHESMIAAQKAESALKLLMQIRTKAIEAYTSIMQMQI